MLALSSVAALVRDAAIGSYVPNPKKNFRCRCSRVDAPHSTTPPAIAIFCIALIRIRKIPRGCFVQGSRKCGERMMKQFLVPSIVLSAFVVSSAMAADLPIRKGSAKI